MPFAPSSLRVWDAKTQATLELILQSEFTEFLTLPAYRELQLG